MIRCDGDFGTKIYEVEGHSYDGCNGWDSWICEGSQTLSYAKAQDYCSKMNERVRGIGNRYTIVERTIY